MESPAGETALITVVGYEVLLHKHIFVCLPLPSKHIWDTVSAASQLGPTLALWSPGKKDFFHKLLYFYSDMESDLSGTINFLLLLKFQVSVLQPLTNECELLFCFCNYKLSKAWSELSFFTFLRHWLKKMNRSSSNKNNCQLQFKFRYNLILRDNTESKLCFLLHKFR